MTEYQQKLQTIAQEEAAEAQQYAKQFKKELDYSSDSLLALEEILDIYAEDIKKYGDIPDSDIWSTASMFGAYLGELMLKQGLEQHGYRWDNPDQGKVPVLYNATKNTGTAPIDKCYKRMVNGREDTLISYYGVTMETLSQSNQ